jgi:Cu(I)/Ag(I) efflux system protein CusF
MPMKDMPACPTPSAGVIKAIDPMGKITLQHGAIPAVSWPAMTMTFAAKPVLLKGLKVARPSTSTVT